MIRPYKEYDNPEQLSNDLKNSTIEFCTTNKKELQDNLKLCVDHWNNKGKYENGHSIKCYKDDCYNTVKFKLIGKNEPVHCCSKHVADALKEQADSCRVYVLNDGDIRIDINKEHYPRNDLLDKVWSIHNKL